MGLIEGLLFGGAEAQRGTARALRHVGLGRRDGFAHHRCRGEVSRSCCRVRATHRTSRCLFRMVFKYSPLAKQPVRFRGLALMSRASGTRRGVTPDSRIATRGFVRVQRLVSSATLCPHDSTPGRAISGPIALSD